MTADTPRAVQHEGRTFRKSAAVLVVLGVFVAVGVAATSGVSQAVDALRPATVELQYADQSPIPNAYATWRTADSSATSASVRQADSAGRIHYDGLGGFSAATTASDGVYSVDGLAAAAVSGSFVPLSPARVLDTRGGGKVGAADGNGAPLTLNVLTKGGLPGSGIGAVALNVTVAEGGNPNLGGGYVTVYPCGTRPNASNLNFTVGQTIPNSVIAPVSTGGDICFYVYGTAHLLADVSGYFPAGSGFTSLSPARVLDTRGGGKVGAADGNGAPLTLNVLTKGGLPGSGIGAVALNVTVAEGGNPNLGGGYVTVYPCGTRPNASNLNFTVGQTIPNSVIAPVSTGGDICFYVYGTAHLLADVSGYFPAGSGFTSLSPARVLDTRGGGKVGAADGNGAPLTLNVLTKGGLPGSGIGAVALNVTVAEGGNPNLGGGYVTVYPCGTRPNASNLNFTVGQTIPNSVIAPVSTGGDICFYVYGTAHLLADVSGYFGPGSPGPVLDRSLTSVISTQSSRWNKFEAVQNSAAVLNLSAAAALDASAITFKSVGVVGLALPDLPSGSGLLAVEASGISTDALASGSASIRDFYSAPNGKYYVVFQSPVPLQDGATPCLLAEVQASTGIPTCVDDTLTSINWSQYQNDPRNNPIQFDSIGEIYYSGTAPNGRGVLRRYASGVKTDLINDNVWINDFLVLADRSVLISGSTQATNASWVRRLSAAGALSNIAAGGSSTFMRYFADGNVYIGLWGGDSFGIKRYSAGTGALESKYWVGGSINGVQGDAYFDPYEICVGPAFSALAGYCGWHGTQILDLISNVGQESFAVSGSRGQSGSILMKYFPTVEKANSIVRTATVVEQAGSTIAQAGTDATGTNVLTIYDTGSRQETILVDAQNEIEIFNMTYVESTNKMMFNGLRFADNKYVVGEIDLS